MTPLEELDALYAFTSATPRQTSRLEATTEAYLDGIYAVAYGHVGAVARARELLARAAGSLAPVREDPVHRALLRVISERVAQVCDGRAWDTASAATLGAIAGLAPRDRDQASRALQRMWLVAPPARRVSTLNRVPTADLPATVARAIATRGGDELEDAFAALLWLPEAEAMTNAIAAPPRIEAAPKLRRPLMAAHVLAACGRCGWGELVPEIAAQLVGNVDPAIPDHLDAARTAIGVLGWFGATDALAPLVQRLAFGASSSRSGVLRDAADAWLGRPPTLFRVAIRDNPAYMLDDARRVAEAVAVAPPSDDHLREVRERWSEMVDVSPTHSHVGLVALTYVDLFAGVIALSASLRPSSSAFAP